MFTQSEARGVIRMHDGNVINSMIEAYAFCDPLNKGFISDQGCFGALVRGCKLDEPGESDADMLRKVDNDGNGYINFPEFVEYFEHQGVRLKLGIKCDRDAGPFGVPYPPLWAGPKGKSAWTHNTRRAVKDPAVLAEFQEMFDLTHHPVATRDRRIAIPVRYKVCHVLANENFHDWRRYCLKREHIHAELRGQLKLGGEGKKWPDQYFPWSNTKAITDRYQLNASNEWMLLHGTSNEAARMICSGDFQLDLAGTATGTLYGKGTYLAESVTKADEYTKPDENNLHCVLLCRAAGGRFLYNSQGRPNGEKLQDSVTRGPTFHCIMGDREKVRGTFKEFVFFDADQIHVEAVIMYSHEP